MMPELEIFWALFGASVVLAALAIRDHWRSSPHKLINQRRDDDANRSYLAHLASRPSPHAGGGAATAHSHRDSGQVKNSGQVKTGWELRAEATARVLAEEFATHAPYLPLVDMLKIAYMQGMCTSSKPDMPREWTENMMAQITQKILRSEET